MHESNADDGRCLRVGSLFSGYGGPDLAVEQVFDARTRATRSRSRRPE